MSNTPAAADLPRTRVPSGGEGGLRLHTHLYFAVGMALLIGMLAASYMQALAGLDAMKQFGRVAQHAAYLDRLNQLLLNAQSAMRGYALTRDPLYLDSYRATVPAIHETLGVVKADQESRREQSAQLIGLALSMTARMETTTQLIQRGSALKKDWFEADTLAMADYQREYNKLKAALLADNLRNVQRSVNGFENARISTVLLAIASMLLLILTVAQKQRINQMLKAENERLEREVRLRTADLTNLATYLTDVREAEKLRLAREMHDELGALLTAAKLDADWIERELPAESQALVAQRLVRLRQNLIRGITLKRRIIDDLRPALLYDLGLIEAVKALIDEFRKAEEIEVYADLPDDIPELSDAVSLSLFRIVQEAFTNIRKYAHASRVSVALHLTPSAIDLSIEDNGVGFDPNSAEVAHHGLAGIKHRVFTHGGQLEIRSSPGTGVAIHASLPREAAAALQPDKKPSTRSSGVPLQPRNR